MSLSANDLNWDKGQGLLPAIIQNVDSGEVLMLGYMNPEAFEATQKTAKVIFYSRTKQRLWQKGETSGNTLNVVSIVVDCDQDTLLIQARPAGPVCHTGTRTCFGDEPGPGTAFLGELQSIIEERSAASPDESYTARLLEKGVLKIAQKVGEEGVETALAGAAEDDKALLNEASDLIYHLTVLLKARGQTLGNVAQCLKARHSNP